MSRKYIKKKLNNKLFINDDLTLQRSKLLDALQRDDIIHRAWSYNRNICCSIKQNQDVIIVIKSPYDLIKHLDYNMSDANSFFPIHSFWLNNFKFILFFFIVCFYCSS